MIWESQAARRVRGKGAPAPWLARDGRRVTRRAVGASAQRQGAQADVREAVSKQRLAITSAASARAVPGGACVARCAAWSGRISL